MQRLSYYTPKNKTKPKKPHILLYTKKQNQTKKTTLNTREKVKARANIIQCTISQSPASSGSNFNTEKDLKKDLESFSLILKTVIKSI